MSGGYKRALFFRHALGNKLLTFLCDVVCDLNLTDMETCYKMVRADLLKSIPLESSTFDVEPELAIKLAKRGARIFEVPISYSGRTYRGGKEDRMEGRRSGAVGYSAVCESPSRIYTDDAHGGEIFERLNRAPRFTRWMADVIRPYMGDRVLEIGAGTGNMSVHLMPRTVYWATDMNPHYLDYLDTLRATRPYMRVGYTNAHGSGVVPRRANFRHGRVPECGRARRGRSSALCEIFGTCLADGGRAIILVPCGPKLYGTLDEVLGHCRRYTEEQTCRVSQHGRIPGRANVEIQSPRRAGLVAEWTRFCGEKTFGLGQIRMLNLLTPIFRLMDPVASAASAFSDRHSSRKESEPARTCSRRMQERLVSHDESGIHVPTNDSKPIEERVLSLRLYEIRESCWLSFSCLRCRSAIPGFAAMALAITRSRAHCSSSTTWISRRTGKSPTPAFAWVERMPAGNIAPAQYTATDHLNNHFSVGPAILWSPFLITAHVGVF